MRPEELLDKAATIILGAGPLDIGAYEEAYALLTRALHLLEKELVEEIATSI